MVAFADGKALDLLAAASWAARRGEWALRL
jgi:hypothetical protein